MPSQVRTIVLLARVRRSMRALRGAFDEACRAAGLTMQQQSFLLVLATHHPRPLALADVRIELLMDQATTSELLARLSRMGLVKRYQGTDRRSVDCALTARGRARLLESIERTDAEIQRVDRDGEIAALNDGLAEYLRLHTSAVGAKSAKSRTQASRRVVHTDRARRRSRAS